MGARLAVQSGGHLCRYARDQRACTRSVCLSDLMQHIPVSFDPRGGGAYQPPSRVRDPRKLLMRAPVTTSDHVDILGNSELNEAIIDIVSGEGDRVQTQIFSDIQKYSKRIEW